MRRLALIALCLAACSSEDPKPSAKIVSAMPDELYSTMDSADDLAIVVDYHDGDGDLGGGFVHVRDCRAADVVTELDIPPIASMEATDKGVPIEGTLDVTVADVGLITPEALPQACADLGVA